MHCTGAVLAVAIAAITAIVLSMSAAAQPTKNKVGGGSLLDKPTFGEKFSVQQSREKTTRAKLRHGSERKQKGGSTGWSQFYRSF
jgi:hypothetical protein